MIAGIIFSFQFESVQTWGAKKATKYLSQELKTTIDINKLYLKPFSSFVLKGVYIQDLDKDTLLSAENLNVDISYFSPFSERKITLEQITLENSKFYLKTYKDSTTNLSFIINYFITGNVNTTAKKPFDFLINNVNIKNLDFKYKNYRTPDTMYNGYINYDDVYIKGLSAAINNLDTKNYILKAEINHLKFKEKSGFVLNDLTAAATIDTNKIVLQNLYLKTPNTLLTDYFSMKFKDYADFDDVQNNVILEGHFKNSKIYAKDISFFAPQLANVNLHLDITGTIKGKVNNLRAKDLTVKLGKTSYVKGNFQVKGLPDIKNTFLDLDFKQVYTNKADIEYIIEKATRKKSKDIPDVIKKFGNINFVGSFIGFVNDFVAYGDFKTKLGRIKSDVNMKINKQNIPSYTGKIQAIDFNLGDLIDEPSINRTSFVANVNGRGFKVDNLYEKLKANVTY
ncbi:MAG: translocation/assembly module TamB, partial [Oligoflexus sp.]|nr:translocation/assembly module TamB [Pseudopedobacter sp.]